MAYCRLVKIWVCNASYKTKCGLENYLSKHNLRIFTLGHLVDSTAATKHQHFPYYKNGDSKISLEKMLDIKMVWLVQLSCGKCKYQVCPFLAEQTSESCVPAIEVRRRQKDHFFSSLSWDGMFYYTFAVSRHIAVGRETSQSVKNTWYYSLFWDSKSFESRVPVKKCLRHKILF